MSNNNETVADIVAMLRANARGERFDDFSFTSLADRIEAAAKREACNFRTLSTKKYCFTWHGVSDCKTVNGEDTYFAPTMIDAVNKFIDDCLSKRLSMFKIDYWEESNT